MTVQVGFVGVGGIASVHLKHMKSHEQVTIAAVCDIVQANADRAATEYGAAAYTDVNLMLEKEKLDVLFVCVPPFAHGDIEEKAAAKGIHLFVEKPLGLDMGRVRAKAERIRQSGIIAGSGYCLRYLDTVAKAKDYLKDKTVAMVRAYYLTSFVQTPWWRIMDKSGGQLVEQTTHTVDLVRYLAGEVHKVYANMALCVMNDIQDISIPDVGSINLVFESGAIGHVDTTFVQPDHRSGLEILGRDFRVWINGSSLTIIDKSGTTETSSEMDFYKVQDEAFIEAVITGNRSLVLCSYDDAMKTLEVTLAANESASKDLPVIIKS